MHVDERVLAPLRERYGEPALLRWEGQVSPDEFSLAGANPARRHDVTLFVFNGDALALIRKPQYPPEIWRPPGGGVRPDETFVGGTRREAYEELGVPVELERYLVRSEAHLHCGDDTIEWQTHVFAARTDAIQLVPEDRVEIEAARWGTGDELAGPLRVAMLTTGRALWRYRVELHDAALAALAA